MLNNLWPWRKPAPKPDAVPQLPEITGLYPIYFLDSGEDMSRFSLIFSTILKDVQDVSMLFIHNPKSQNEFSIIIGASEVVVQLAQGIKDALDAARHPAAAVAAAPAPAVVAK
jgi:hypothetical protein